MTDPLSTGAGGSALIKIFGVPIIASATATALAFMFMWPKTLKEAFIRIVCTVIASSVFGPLLVFALHAWWPEVFESARAVVALYGMPRDMGVLMLAGPIMVISGIPAWWIIGGLIRWFEKRKDKDIGEMIQDARDVMGGDK